MDTLRADRIFSDYKNRSLTPTISSLLNNSIYFKNCIAQSPYTLPSHISMFTGLYPSQNYLISKDLFKLSGKIPILTEILKNMGYITICYTENPFISKIYGLTKGFDKVFQNFKRNLNSNRAFKNFQIINYLNKIDAYSEKKIGSKPLLKILHRNKMRILTIIEYIIKKLIWRKNIVLKYRDTLTELDKLSQLLKHNNKDNSFYLFFNIMATHHPYIPIKEVSDYFGIKIKDFRKIKNFFFDFYKYVLMLNEKYKKLSKKKDIILKKLYNACVFYNDLIVERILTILKKFGLLENSYIIITSDHGEHLGDQFDHYLWGHATLQSVYESVIKVPLLIYNSNFKKKIIKNQVELKDLFHTILHLTGINGTKNKYFDLAKSIINQTNTNSTPEYIFGEYLKSKKNLKKIFNTYQKFIIRSLILKQKNNIYFLRTQSYKLINFNNKYEEFYNLVDDPHELINNVNENDVNYRKLKIKMKEFIKNNENTEKLKELITNKEKDLVRSITRILH